jgi:hypothetical protein
MQIPSASMFAGPSGASQTQASSSNMKWADAASEETSGARGEFAKYMKMTPAEKMHAAMLSQLGVSEDEYKAMSPDDRAALDQKIKEMIKQQAETAARDGGKKGILADVTV